MEQKTASGSKKLVRFVGSDCVVELGRYTENGRKAIMLLDAISDELVAAASVNMPEVPLAENEVLIKDYSENAGILKVLEEAGIVRPTGESVSSGFVSLRVCELLI